MAYMYLFQKTSIKTKFLTISATLCNNHTNKYIITLFFLRFLLWSTKLACPKQMLKSQFSVGPFADSVLCNSPSIKLIWWHVHCFTEQTTDSNLTHLQITVDIPSYFLTGNLICSLMQPTLWLVWHAHMHNSLSLADLIALSTPKRNLCSKILKLRELFVFYMSP